jgi:hypothetical protein
MTAPLRYFVGTRVLAVHSVGNSEAIGVLGTMLSDYDSRVNSSVKVQFDEDISGHDCNGMGVSGRCWSCTPNMLVFNPPKCKLKLHHLKLKHGIR